MLPLCKNWRNRTKTLINMSFLKLSVTLILISVSSVVFAQKIKGVVYELNEQKKE